MLAPSTGTEASARLALARARGAVLPDCGGFSFLVDLAGEPVGARWARGAATLALLCGAALALSPGMDPFSPALAHSVAPTQQFQINRMLGVAATTTAPQQEAFEPLAKPVVASTRSEVRIQGPVTEGLYWSLREAGVPSHVAADYLHALSTRIDVGADVAPYDRFDLVVSKKPGAGEPLLYAALHRAQGADVELLKWSAAGKADWYDTDASGAEQSAGLMAPVAGRVTSRFGVRYHPILHFARMHSGIDFGAAWGSPIVAAADGQVVAAGWAGGYGRQVRIAHDGGIVSSYSHMSSLATAPGQPVRQGQVIGYVGSTGLSTGPHLHFEVKVNGRAVDPMSVQLQRRNVITGPAKQAFEARVKQLQAIGKA
jgi:murein DD-endopeptidase MepM/ murein hydrolase activator NlpD